MSQSADQVPSRRCPSTSSGREARSRSAQTAAECEVVFARTVPPPSNASHSWRVVVSSKLGGFPKEMVTVSTTPARVYRRELGITETDLSRVGRRHVGESDGEPGLLEPLTAQYASPA